MRVHDHDHDETAATAHHEGRRDNLDAHLVQAAVSGRNDVLGRSGLRSLQRAVGNAAVGSMLAEDEQRSPVHNVISAGGGQPLDADTRSDMETRLGADFSDVRVHTDGPAGESAKGVGAHAYTVGNNVVFQRDRYDPSSPGGRTMLAHELTHVIQQRNGPVDGTEAPGGIRVSDPSDRYEQEAAANADRVLADPAPTAAPAPQAVAATASTAAPTAQLSVQRAEDEDEEPADVQGSFVQRAESGEKEDEEEPTA